MKLTRRQLAAAIAPAALASAQTPAPQPPAPQRPADDLAAARELLKTTANALGSVKLPIAVEPAFQFKA
jgi:hypothetical protein